MLIISMTTIPSRFSLLEKSISSLLKQTKQFDKFVINLDSDICIEDLKKYDSIKSLDSRIEIGFGDKRWKPALKLIPTLQKYPDDVIITVDDDIEYPENTIEELYKGYLENPNCIVCAEHNTAHWSNLTGELYFKNTFPNRFGFLDYGKYLTNCCLFPPHTFDDTEIFNIDKYLEITNGNNDEFYFWCCSTYKGIRVKTINLSHSMSEYNIPNDTAALTDINRLQETLDNYNSKANQYFDFKSKRGLLNVNITFTPDNYFTLCLLRDKILSYYCRWGIEFSLSPKLSITQKDFIKRVWNP